MRFQSQIYHRDQCITFLKTAEQFGGLSNMAGGYPLLINNISILTSEALYQACRFPHKPEIQKIILAQRSPMTAKMKSKPHITESRSDWNNVRIPIMWWCLRVKLAQHWEKFGNLLLSTGDKPIVEISYRDQFWGAKPITSEDFEGTNVLGQLLSHLRDRLKQPDRENLRIVSPPNLFQFLLMGDPINIPDLQKQEPALSQVALFKPSAKDFLVPVVGDAANNEKPQEDFCAPIDVPALLDPANAENKLLVQQLPLPGFIL